MLGRQTAPRLHKPGVSLGERDGDAGRDDGSSTRWGEGDVLSSEEIDPCITEPRIRRQREIGIEAENRQIEHKPNVADAAVYPETMLA